MPIMGGLETSHIIRNKPPFSTNINLRFTPIIAMGASSITSEQELERLRNMGCNDLLIKPIRRRNLQQILFQYTRHQPRHVPGIGMAMAPVWGPVGLRAYRGPRSRM
jgi:CheY-like chemotaxis protein